LRPGQRISASDYLTSWNVSITPFRDAVRTLQNRGFVTVEPRKGVFVAEINDRGYAQFFQLEQSRISGLRAAKQMLIDLSRIWDARNPQFFAVRGVHRGRCGWLYLFLGGEPRGKNEKKNR